MKKFGSFLLWLLFGALLWQQIGYTWKYLLFSPAMCARTAFQYHFWPLAGQMNNASWAAMVAILIVGILLSVSFAPKFRKLFLFLAIISGITFDISLVIADTKCRSASLCSEDFIASTQSIIRRSYNALDVTICADLDDLNVSCPEAVGGRTKASCEDTLRKIITYKSLGIDVKGCMSRLEDCRNEYLNYFYDNLTNDIYLAPDACDQKYGNVETAGRLCHAYVNEWRASGAKPKALIQQ